MVNDLYVSQETKFNNYMELLLEWNEKINLTAITEKEDIILKHFKDSLTIEEFIPENAKVIDVGTGAGFPGIPLKIVRKDISLTLLDSLNKRIKFLDEVVNNLELENVETIHSRAEDAGMNKKYREQYDIATSRAVANLSTLLEYLMPFVKVGGSVICMKGPNIEEELNKAKHAISELGGEIQEIKNFKLEGTDNERNIIIIKKVKPISGKYPRKAGMPANNPL